MSGVGGVARWWGWALSWAWLAIGVVVAQEGFKGPLRKLDSKLLPNAIWVDPSVMSGGLPAGKPAFDELARLGIKTVISVDGIKPDVDGAEAAGLRYVHLPHGYDGIHEERLLQIAKGVRDLPGPVYIHCHHGKHRSPTAAAAVCVALGKIDPSRGLEILRAAGTNPGFRGLWQAVERAVPVPEDRLDAVRIDFVSVSEVPPIVDAMVAMDSILDRLQGHQQAGWKDSVAEAASDALMLKEHYVELLRSESERNQEAGFLDLLEQGRKLAEALETRLQTDRFQALTEDTVYSNNVLKQMTNTCSQCHTQYRDNR
ncbi:MAG: hypothetical protein ACK553_00670 [Planctomycetota bacterium]|jgi:hypothetical protein